MNNWVKLHDVLLASVLLSVAWLYYGYLAWLDGNFIMPVASVISQQSPYANGCEVTHVTTKDKYKRGELVEAKLIIEKYRNIEGIVQWNLMDARYYPYSPRRVILPKGRHEIIIPIEIVPSHIPPGPDYHFSGSVKYEPNAVSDIYQSLRTNKFEVVE